MTDKIQKLTDAAKTSANQKKIRLEKKLHGMEKRLQALQKKGEDTTQVEQQLAKTKKEVDQHAETGEGCEFSKSIPLSRFQTDTEFESKSSRAKMLVENLQAASDQAQSPNGLIGVQAMTKALRDKGLMALKPKKKTNSDKGIQDIMKLGSHLMK